MATGQHDAITSLEDLHDALPPLNYAPLWAIRAGLGNEPSTSMVPYIWRFEEVRPLILRAGDLISAEQAERRALGLRNPGTPEGDVARATDTLWGAIQLVLPGETAPPHRHTASALRFVIEGRGAYSIVDGVRCEMEPGDLVAAPNWAWHEHGHDGEGPMIWLDGLDLPMVVGLKARFAEDGDGFLEGRALAPAALRTGELLPRFAQAQSPVLVYKLADAEASLEALRDEGGSPFDDLILEYRNPLTGGPLMPTISAYVQMLRPRVTTRAHKHTASAVYHVVRGSGVSEIGGQRIEWTRGDTFALPGWTEHRHSNPAGEDALLFSYSDAAAMSALNLLREQPVDA